MCQRGGFCGLSSAVAMTQPFGTLVLSDTLTSTKTNTGVDGPCHQLVWVWWRPVGIPGEGAIETAGVRGQVAQGRDCWDRLPGLTQGSV